MVLLVLVGSARKSNEFAKGMPDSCVMRFALLPVQQIDVWIPIVSEIDRPREVMVRANGLVFERVQVIIVQCQQLNKRMD